MNRENFNILVVDDEKDYCDVLKMILTGKFLSGIVNSVAREPNSLNYHRRILFTEPFS